MKLNCTSPWGNFFFLFIQKLKGNPDFLFPFKMNIFSPNSTVGGVLTWQWYKILCTILIVTWMLGGKIIKIFLVHIFIFRDRTWTDVMWPNTNLSFTSIPFPSPINTSFSFIYNYIYFSLSLFFFFFFFFLLDYFQDPLFRILNTLIELSRLLLYNLSLRVFSPTFWAMKTKQGTGK